MMELKKFASKEMYPIFVCAKCCWSVHSKVVRLGKHVPSKQKKATSTQLLQFHVNFMWVPCLFCIYRVYAFNIWFGMVQHQKQVGYGEGRKIG